VQEERKKALGAEKRLKADRRAAKKEAQAKLEDTAGTRWCFPQKNPLRDTFCEFQRVFLKIYLFET